MTTGPGAIFVFLLVVGGCTARNIAPTDTGGGAAGGGAGADAAGSGGAGTGGTATGGGGTDGAGTGGAGGLCADACTNGATRCLSSTSLAACAAADGGCTAPSISTCATGTVCERQAPADCVDPSWAEWPMPNLPADATAGAPNPESYTDNGDGTVTDNVTGLMWQQAVPATTSAQAAAVATCATLTLAGDDDWRLPSVIELVSIVDYGRASPSINGTYFPGTPPGTFWASSSIGTTYAWKVSFTDGSTSTEDFAATYNVRCVR